MTNFALPLPTKARSNAPIRKAIQSQLHVLHAVILHDIKGRFFGNGLGYVVTIVWPAAHIAVIVGAHSVAGRETPYGSSALLYASTGVLPYIAWNYISRFTGRSVVQNRSFLQYPVIKVLDLIFARQILEVVSCAIITFALLIVLMLCQIDVMPSHPARAAMGLLSAVVLGLGFGVMNGAICVVFPLWDLVYIIVILTLYFTSGVIINPEALPAAYGDILAWNPLVHSVELLRSAYYDDYPTRLLDPVYVFYVGGAAFALGLLMERVTRLVH